MAAIEALLVKVYTPGMAHRFKTVDRNTPLFLPPEKENKRLEQLEITAL